MAQLYSVINKKPDRLLYRESQLLLSNTEAIGVEVEIENCKYLFQSGLKEEPKITRFEGEGVRDLSMFWHVIKDGSLRNGTEFTFNGPLKGANITEALNDLHMFFKDYRYKGSPVEPSDRTSVHVHLDFRDNSEKELLNFIMIYIMVERVVFTYCNINRSKNNYCRPLTDSDFIHLVRDMKYYSDSGLLSNLLDAIRNTCDKYSALNILPLTTYGSMEFRHHQGTSDINSLIDWINIIFAIKNASLQYSIKDLVDYYDRWGSRVLYMIFKGSVFQNIYTNRDIASILRKGVTDVKEILNFERLRKTKSKSYLVKGGVGTIMEAYAIKNGIIKTSEIKKRATKTTSSSTSNESLFTSTVDISSLFDEFTLPIQPTITEEN